MWLDEAGISGDAVPTGVAVVVVATRRGCLWLSPQPPPAPAIDAELLLSVAAG